MTSLSDRTESATERFETESAKLLREDGSRRYSDAEHKEREAALRQELGEALDAIEADADAEISRAEAILARHADRSALLSTDELTAANARRAFVQEDADSLLLDELAQRIEAVAEASGTDRAGAFLFARYGRARALREKAADARVEFTDEYGRLEAALSRVEDGLSTSEERAARRAIEEAREVKGQLYLRRRGVRTPLELHRLQRYG